MIFNSENFKTPSPIPKVSGVISSDLIVEKDGSISDVIIVEGLYPDLDKETVRLYKTLPKFIPGKINGQPVRSKYRIHMVIRYRES